jgi:hypothetical protein
VGILIIEKSFKAKLFRVILIFVSIKVYYI